MKSSQLPPKDYLDGCTFFPDSFGKISHKKVCDEHDTAYWTKRTYLSKIKADFVWWWGVVNIHRNNSIFWFLIAFVCASFGLLALLTFGNWFWFRRHRWDKKNGKTNIKSRS